MGVCACVSTLSIELVDLVLQPTHTTDPISCALFTCSGSQREMYSSKEVVSPAGRRLDS